MLIQLEGGGQGQRRGKIPGVHVPRSIWEGIFFNVHSRTDTVWTCWVVVFFKFLLWHIAGLEEGSWNSSSLLWRHKLSWCHPFKNPSTATEYRLTVYPYSVASSSAWRPHHSYDVITSEVWYGCFYFGSSESDQKFLKNFCGEDFFDFPVFDALRFYGV